MDICSLLPANNLNIGLSKSNTNSNTNNSSTSCNSSISTTINSGENKVCASPPLTASPTDSLKFLTSTLVSNLNCTLNNASCQKQTNLKLNELNISHKANEYEIIKLINEHHQQQQQQQQQQQHVMINLRKISSRPCVVRNQYENSDLHMFEIFNNGGFLELPKYCKQKKLL